LIFSKEVQKLQKENFRPIEQITLEPYERDHAIVFGRYRTNKFSNFMTAQLISSNAP